MAERLEIKTLKIIQYYIFCMIMYFILSISIMGFIIYSNKIFLIITPMFLRNLYQKYYWLQNIYFLIILIILFLVFLFFMHFFRKLFEKKCIFVFNNNGFSFSIGLKQYNVNKTDIVINCYKNVSILPASYSNPDYYKIIILNKNNIYEINTQLIKTLDSIINTLKLIEKLKEYYADLEIVDNRTFFGGFNKRIKKRNVA